MSGAINWTALSVFIFFFLLITIMGFAASRWQSRGSKRSELDEWGLGGRRFGTWITWFLVGGDFYTAYTIIAVPALVYAVGAYGFFAKAEQDHHAGAKGIERLAGRECMSHFCFVYATKNRKS